MNKIGLCILLLAAGCQWGSEQIIPAAHESQMTVRQDAAGLEQRFTDSQKIDPMQSLNTWTQRYEELLKQTEQLRKERMQLSEDNSRLQQETILLKSQLEQIRKEQEQSNALLGEAHTELSKWKSDVLGFRDEMRQAQTAQLLALSKILRILGAESVDSQSQPPASPKPAPPQKEGGS